SASGLVVEPGRGDHLPARLAARVDRDHRDLLPDLHPAAEPLPDRPHPLRHDGGGQSPGGIPLAAGGDVGVLSQDVSPKPFALNQIFAGMMPYMIIVCICLVFMYIWPGMALWLS